MSKDKSNCLRSDEAKIEDLDLDAAVGGSITQTVTRSIETGRSGTARSSGSELEEINFEATFGF